MVASGTVRKCLKSDRRVTNKDSNVRNVMELSEVVENSPGFENGQKFPKSDRGGRKQTDL